MLNHTQGFFTFKEETYLECFNGDFHTVKLEEIHY